MMKPGKNKKEDGPKDQLSKSMKVGKSELLNKILGRRENETKF